MPFSTFLPSLFGSSSPNHSLDRESQCGFALIEEDDVSQTTLNIVPSDNYGQQQFNPNYQQQQQQEALPNMLPVNNGFLNQVPQPDFFGHNIGYAPNQYYGGMMGAYGQLMIPPQPVDVPTRLPLAPEMGIEPVFVNAKQYHAILRRRKSRAKAEIEKKLIKERKPYLHESRHQHAIKRARGIGGRFSMREEFDSLKTIASDPSKRESPVSSETPKGESPNSHNYNPSPGYDFLSSDIGDDWLNISSPNQGQV